LMRNGVVAALFPLPHQEIEALDATVLQGIITHWAPLPVLTCVVQTLLIRHALNTNDDSRKAPTLSDIKELLAGPWANWQKTTTNEDCKMWLKNIGTTLLQQMEKQLIKELEGFESYDPWHQDYRGRSGYCVLTLLIALWSLHWSFRSDRPPESQLPKWLPEWIFQKHEFDTIMWVVCIGADADTYGATAGPMLAAYHNRIGANLLENLQLRNEIEQLFKPLAEYVSKKKGFKTKLALCVQDLGNNWFIVLNKES